MVRAKFMVLEANLLPGGATQVVMAPQYDPEIPEDRRFLKATPAGRLEMLIDNPAAIDQLQPGRHFYLDLSAAD